MKKNIIINIAIILSICFLISLPFIFVNAYSYSNYKEVNYEQPNRWCKIDFQVLDSNKLAEDLVIKFLNRNCKIRRVDNHYEGYLTVPEGAIKSINVHMGNQKINAVKDNSKYSRKRFDTYVFDVQNFDQPFVGHIQGKGFDIVLKVKVTPY